MDDREDAEKRERIQQAKGSMAGLIAPTEQSDETMDRSDIEMLFRSIMQFARHLAKKYGFTIKQWPEK